MGEYIHSQQARFNDSHVSCGIVEMHHLPDLSPNQTLFALANRLYHKANGRPAAYVMFSDVVNLSTPSRGELLAEYIGGFDSNVAGVLWQSSRQANPKTGNIIVVWVLTVNHDTFRDWYVGEYANRVSELV